ncbi:Flp pilus assembly protein CpaB [Lipingzhangella sp. LS1_29]|uniref:Flp pilus assembly protein CpaB n=1 Tax=Lipingzhangella rawalii TaxID=2055835 RepID=A0ABU2H6N0_9ACTN|nr:Flp pilus assembly protein CpaB [Lipingzhangella rawalii]MDS1270958.1 Flp pilus assembly protein CpaB [Lipingzhangella rawalii]
MNPRQRRGILLLITAGIGAIAVFVAVWGYTNSLHQRLGEYQTAVLVAEDIPAHQPVTPDLLETTEVPADFFEDSFLRDPTDVEVGAGEQLVAAVDIEAGTMLQENMLQGAPALSEGEREIAIMVDAETGVAGKINRGSLVDVYATYAASPDSPACAMRVLTQVQVLDIGEITTETDETTGAQSGVVPVTFRLSPEQTLHLTHAEAFSTKLRLGLISPEGGGSEPAEMEFCSDTDIEEFFEDADNPIHDPYGEDGPDLAEEDDAGAEGDADGDAEENGDNE